MKNIIGKLSIGALLFCAAACSGDDLPVYEDVDRVLFSWPTTSPVSPNTTRFSFGYDIPMKPDSIISVGVRLMGRFSDQDRPIKAEVIWAESSVTPEDIEFLPSVIRAKSRNGTLYVKLKNTDKLLTKTLQAKIRLAPNEYFHVDRNTYQVGGSTYAALEYNIEFDAKADMPNMWKDGTVLTTYFRTYSKKKELWIYHVTGFTRENFTYDPVEVQAAMQQNQSSLQTEVNNQINKVLPGDYIYGVLSQLGRWLKVYQEGTSLYPDGAPGSKKAGDPLLDEDGRPMEVMGSAAGSYN
ncbi:MAG: DUF4843 domain-containing protein [Culturomica sp.]|jgi:hypothetical protein|nr:DUF4843 domain-containing protein [Culturomica sp.]